MRRTPAWLGLLLVLASPVAGQSADSVEQLLTEWQYRNPEGREAIRAQAADLTDEEKSRLYDQFEVSGWWMLGNMYPGLPVGSLIQGDLPTVFTMAEVTWVGISLAVLANFDYTSSPGREIMTYGGFAVAAFGYGWALVEPWLFADQQNRNLRDALGGPP